MKPLFLRALLLSLAMLAASCGGGSPASNEQTSASAQTDEPAATTTTTTTTTTTGTVDAVAAPNTEPAAAAIKATRLTEGLNQPWSLNFLPDGGMLITEKAGKLRLANAQGQLIQEITGLPRVKADGQGGLLDLEISPDFLIDRAIYFSYSQAVGTDAARTAVARAQLSNNTLTKLTEIFAQQPALSGSSHFGSRLVFDESGYLYVTLGDRRQRGLVQSLGNTAGKVVRIRTDGSIPPDNPFVNTVGAEAGIFSYGHRNPQSIARHPVTGAIWVGEHGPLGGDEINLIRAGANYGWPRITHGREYATGAAIGEGTTATDVEPALRFWVPTSIAPAGMTFYTGNKVPALTNTLLVGALAERALIRLSYTNTGIVFEESLLRELNERIRDVAVSPDGYPHVLTDSGNIYRIEMR